MSHGITTRWKRHKDNAPRLFVQAVWWHDNRCRNTSYSVEYNGMVGAVELCYRARKRAGAPLPPMPADLLALMLPIPPRPNR